MKNSTYYLVSLILALAACQVINSKNKISPTLQSPLYPTQSLVEFDVTKSPHVIKLTSTNIASATLSSPTMTPSTSMLTANIPTVNLPIIIGELPGPLYTTVFSIPVGGGSIVQYRGVNNPNMEISGPDAIAVLPDDTFIIADLIANRLLHYDISGKLLNKIELTDLGIENVADLRVEEETLYLLEISLDFSPQRYRVNQLSFEGNLITSDEIPPGFYVEDGLTGIAIDCDGSIFLEVGLGYELYRLKDVQKNSKSAKPSGYYCINKLYQVMDSSIPNERVVMVGDVMFKTQLTTNFGGMYNLNVFQDGSFYMLREDVISDPLIRVDQTVHFIGADMTSKGMARVPLSEALYYIMRNIVANAKGEVYVLLPRYDSLDVVKLNFFKRLEPLPPSTIAPQITISTSQP